MPLEAMQGRQVVVLCNLKARNMRGIKCALVQPNKLAGYVVGAEGFMVGA